MPSARLGGKEQSFSCCGYRERGKTSHQRAPAVIALPDQSCRKGSLQRHRGQVLLPLPPNLRLWQNTQFLANVCLRHSLIFQGRDTTQLLLLPFPFKARPLHLQKRSHFFLLLPSGHNQQRHPPRSGCPKALREHSPRANAEIVHGLGQVSSSPEFAHPRSERQQRLSLTGYSTFPAADLTSL